MWVETPLALAENEERIRACLECSEYSQADGVWGEIIKDYDGRRTRVGKEAEGLAGKSGYQLCPP